ncbi:hypothetical protein ACHQM5_021841 [Ranunculus cassubicifolius]
MANSSSAEESSPLLKPQHEKTQESAPAPMKSTVEEKSSLIKCGVEDEWTVDGHPLGHGGSVVGEPVGRNQWNSSLFSCFGRNDEFCSSDLEVCLIGGLAPCVLYGSNAERLGSGTGTFANHCLPYTGLYLLGNSLYGWNCMAPLFSHSTRTQIRRQFNLEASCEALSRSCGCCGGMIEDEVQREKCETACDVFTHFFCHTCSLCQEGRELRRRLPHPGFNGRVMVMIPPSEQMMDRSRA